jgi:hypothetical protein
MRAMRVVGSPRGSVGNVAQMQQNRVTSLVRSTSLSQVVHVSSNANNGVNAGSFYLNSNNDASNANRNISTRLIRLNLSSDASSPLGEIVDHNSLVGTPKNWVGRSRI